MSNEFAIANFQHVADDEKRVLFERRIDRIATFGKP